MTHTRRGRETGPTDRKEKPMSNYMIISAYSEQQYNELIAGYEASGCTTYTNISGATEVYSHRVCLAVIHKEF